MKDAGSCMAWFCRGHSAAVSPTAELFHPTQTNTSALSFYLLDLHVDDVDDFPILHSPKSSYRFNHSTWSRPHIPFPGFHPDDFYRKPGVEDVGDMRRGLFRRQRSQWNNVYSLHLDSQLDFIHSIIHFWLLNRLIPRWFSEKKGFFVISLLTCKFINPRPKSQKPFFTRKIAQKLLFKWIKSSLESVS